eukprot:COSAG01_NODE_3761_length_5722_cov_2.962298_10_plen_76_part_00
MAASSRRRYAIGAVSGRRRPLRFGALRHSTQHSSGLLLKSPLQSSYSPILENYGCTVVIFEVFRYFLRHALGGKT